MANPNPNSSSLPSKMIMEISSGESDNFDSSSDDEVEMCSLVASASAGLVPGFTPPCREIVEISSDESDSSDDDEVEICSSVPSASAGLVPGFTPSNCEASSSGSKMSDLLLRKGFPPKAVFKAIQEHGENDEEAVLNTIYTYMALQNHVSDDPRASAESTTADHVDLSDLNSVRESEAMKSLEDASRAIERYGLETPIANLVDFIHAAKIKKEDDSQGSNDVGPQRKCKKRKVAGPQRKCKKRKVAGPTRLTTIRNRRKAMIGFGVPNAGITVVQRELPAQGGGKGPPYFYFENIARALKGSWEEMSRYLYEIQPEFVDSIHFCAAARKRGYIHNLPIDGRFPILPIPPSTIQEALPFTKQWWPKWDARTKLNCIRICRGSAKDAMKITEELNKSGPDPPEHVRKSVLKQCRKYNFVWVGKKKVAPLELDEMEALMGYPTNHTRGGGISTTARYECLGNTFQVDTVAYHLSVLKRLFPDGIKVLSLFSGIGGAEVALDRLGIPLKFVVSVESSKDCQNVLQSWWVQSNQKGVLIHLSDVRGVTFHKLKELMDMSGGFDLVIGGSPCNNISGSNRKTRNGLEGEQSSLFYDYSRILRLVRMIILDRARN